MKLVEMERAAIPIGESAADKQRKAEEGRRAIIAAAKARALQASVSYTRRRAEVAAHKLIKARARQGNFAVPPGATALDLIDLVDELAKDPAALHVTIKARDLACLRTWNATRRLMLQVAEDQDNGVDQPDKAVGVVLPG